MPDPSMLRTRQVAALLGHTREEITRMAARGELPPPEQVIIKNVAYNLWPVETFKAWLLAPKGRYALALDRLEAM